MVAVNDASSPIKRHRTQKIVSVVILASVALMQLIAPVGGRAVLVNVTRSEPLGLYVRTNLAPIPGRLIAFSAPAAAFPFANGDLSYLHHVPLLKMVAAGPGDRVCANSDHVVINGQLGPLIAKVDQQRRALPHWAECRTLRAGELFALAAHIPNSFDSRYFGPVRLSAIIGVFQPLISLPDAP